MHSQHFLMFTVEKSSVLCYRAPWTAILFWAKLIEHNIVLVISLLNYVTININIQTRTVCALTGPSRYIAWLPG